MELKEQERMLPGSSFDRGLIATLYKELKRLNKKMNNPINIRIKDMGRPFFKDKIYVINRHEKMLNFANYQRGTNCYQDAILPQSE